MEEALSVVRPIAADGWLDDAEGENADLFRATVLLVLAARWTPDYYVLRVLTGYPETFVSRCNKNLRDNRVWHYGTVDVEWLDGKTDVPAMALMLDAMVAVGEIERVSGFPEWKWRSKREAASSDTAPRG